MRILLASGERLAGALVKALQASGHQVVGVVSPIPKRLLAQQFRGLRYWRTNLRGWDIRDCCLAARIPMRIAPDLSDGSLHSWIRRSKPDLLLVFSWPRIVKERTLRLFPRGGINIHPSLLPKWRGGDPIFFMLDAGDEQMGLSFHRMTAQVDAGPLYLQAPLPIAEGAGYDEVYLRVLGTAAKLIDLALESQDRDPSGQEQGGNATTCPKFDPAMTRLDPSGDPQALSRRARASYPHHPMNFHTAGGHFQFKGLSPRGSLAESQASGTILRVGWSSLDLALNGRCCRLTKVRRHGWPPLFPLPLLGLRKGQVVLPP
jgi:methionyl-tRNA formyltransferase